MVHARLLLCSAKGHTCILDANCFRQVEQALAVALTSSKSLHIALSSPDYLVVNHVVQGIDLRQQLRRRQVHIAGDARKLEGVEHAHDVRRLVADQPPLPPVHQQRGGAATPKPWLAQLVHLPAC